MVKHTQKNSSATVDELFECAGHILDLYCIRLSNAAPFCENYTKFDTKHLEKGLNRGERGEIFGTLLANIECCPKFLEYALLCLTILWVGA